MAKTIAIVYFLGDLLDKIRVYGEGQDRGKYKVDDKSEIAKLSEASFLIISG